MFTNLRHVFRHACHHEPIAVFVMIMLTVLVLVDLAVVMFYLGLLQAECK